MAVLGCLFALAFAFGVNCLVAWLVMLLWNVIAHAYGLQPLTFWVSFCIMMLLNFVVALFKPNPAIQEWFDNNMKG
jgi:hypothetical protein